MKWKLLDIERCIGCETCEHVCEFIHGVPYSMTVYTDELFALRIACFHCKNAPCVNVCPTKALKIDKEGFVVLRYFKCVACGLCATACPFGIPRLSPVTRTMGKCHACVERRAEGLNPACWEMCPSGAIMYGDMGEILLKILLKEKNAVTQRIIEKVT